MQFLLAGAALFLLQALFAPAPDTDLPPDVIEVSGARRADLAARFKAVWGREPTAEEQAGLIDDWIREEVFAREAIALGLDQGDPVIRARLRQKIEVMAEETGAMAPVAEAEAAAFLASHRDRYAAPSQTGFRQVALRSADPASVAAIRLQLLANMPLAGLTAIRMLPVENRAMPEPRIAETFGDRFAKGIAACPVGEWCGPVLSDFGPHLVFVETRAPGRIPALGEVREAVLRDIEALRRREAADRYFEAAKAAYEIRLDPSSGAGP